MWTGNGQAQYGETQCLFRLRLTAKHSKIGPGTY